jgi:hypothetical protein
MGAVPPTIPTCEVWGQAYKVFFCRAAPRHGLRAQNTWKEMNGQRDYVELRHHSGPVPRRVQCQQFACSDVCRGSPRSSHSMLSKLHKPTACLQTDLPGATLTTRCVNKKGSSDYSQFHFGAGEASVIEMVSAIEATSDNSLIIIEEIENGLHPLATQKMVEYLFDVARRKKCQLIFTTHWRIARQQRARASRAVPSKRLVELVRKYGIAMALKPGHLRGTFDVPNPYGSVMRG